MPTNNYHGHTINVFNGPTRLPARRTPPTNMIRERARSDLYGMTMDEAIDINTRHYLQFLLAGECEI